MKYQRENQMVLYVSSKLTIKVAKCHFEQQNKDKSFFQSNLDTRNREPSLIKKRQSWRQISINTSSRLIVRHG